MAIAVSGSKKRPTPCRFRDRAKTGGLSGQSTEKRPVTPQRRCGPWRLFASLGVNGPIAEPTGMLVVLIQFGRETLDKNGSSWRTQTGSRYR
jgi:hypothetical protein